MPPPWPCSDTIGMPAIFSDSTSRRMVRRDTSNRSASSVDVTLSFCSKIERIPISLSIFTTTTCLSDVYGSIIAYSNG